MRLSAWRLVAALSLVVAVATPIGILGSTPASALSGGLAARGSDPLSRATVYITSMTPVGRSRAQVGNCSGVLIEPQLVLTAGHCLAELEGPSLVVAQFYDRSNRLEQTIQVVSGALHPDYAGRASEEQSDPQLLGADLAVLKLAEPAPADREPVPFARNPTQAVKAFSVLSGAGLRAPHDESSGGQLRIAPVSAEVVTSGPTAVALGVAGGLICRGDSGGPVVVPTAGLWGIVIAIVKRKGRCNSTVFMAVLDPKSHGFRTMVSRARRS